MGVVMEKKREGQLFFKHSKTIFFNYQRIFKPFICSNLHNKTCLFIM